MTRRKKLPLRMTVEQAESHEGLAWFVETVVGKRWRVVNNLGAFEYTFMSARIASAKEMHPCEADRFPPKVIPYDPNEALLWFKHGETHDWWVDSHLPAAEILSIAGTVEHFTVTSSLMGETEFTAMQAAQ